MTAVAFAECLVPGSVPGLEKGILSIGTECGRIEVWAIPVTISMCLSDKKGSVSPILLHALPFNDCHFDSVKKIAWRPVNKCREGTDEEECPSMLDLSLASCGKDCGVRIFKLRIRTNIS